MAATIPTKEPVEVTAGDTWSWQVAFTDYPSSLFALAYTIAGIDLLPWDASYSVAQPDGSFLVTIPKTATGLRGGLYRFVRYVTDSTTRTSADLPALNILDDPASLSAGDARPREEIDLEVVRAAISGRLTDGMQGYMITGRQVQFIPPLELRKEEAVLMARLAAMRNGGNDPLGQSIRFEFDRPSGMIGSDPWR